MKTNTGSLAAAAIATLIGSTVLMPGASNASTPSSPAERAATAELNRDITIQNTLALDRNRVLQAQYQEQMKQYELEQRQFRAQRDIYLNATP